MTFCCNVDSDGQFHRIPAYAIESPAQQRRALYTLARHFNVTYDGHSCPSLTTQIVKERSSD